jgi:hypothetical protein
MRNAYNLSVEMHGEKMHFGRPGRKWRIILKYN